MPDAPRRKLIQIHFSSALLLMFVASGLLWVNLVPRHVVVIYRFGLHNDSNNPSVVTEEEHINGTEIVYGWPFTTRSINNHLKVATPDGWEHNILPNDHTDSEFIFYNSVAALLILSATVFLWEMRNRHSPHTKV